MAIFFFEDQKYGTAIKLYKKALDIFELGDDVDDNGIVVGEKSDPTKVNNVNMSLFLNMAQCYLKQTKWLKAKEYASKALVIDPTNTKGLYRQALAEIELREYENAEKHLNEVLSRDPENKFIKTSLTRLKKATQKVKTNEKQMYSGIFEKMAVLDEKNIQEKKKFRWKFRYQFTQIWQTLKIYKKAHQLLFENIFSNTKKTEKNKFWFYLVIPGIFSVVYGMMMLLLGYLFFGGVVEFLFSGVSDWWIISYIQTIIYIILWLLMGIVVMTTYKMIIFSLISTWMHELSSKVENFLLNELIPEKKPSSIFDDFFQNFILPIKNSAKEFLLMFTLTSLSFIIPGLGITSPFLSFLISSYFTGINLLGYTLQRKKNSTELTEFHRNNWGKVMGVGIGFWCLMGVPLVGWMLAPAYATVVGTMVVVNEEKKKRN